MLYKISPQADPFPILTAAQWIKTLDNKIDLKLHPQEFLEKIGALGGKKMETYVL